MWLPQRKEVNGSFYKGLIQLAGAFACRSVSSSSSVENGLPNNAVMPSACSAARSDESKRPLMTTIATERRRLMHFYEAGLAAYAGERERWAEDMAKVSTEDASNPYYAWFLAEARDAQPEAPQR